MKLQQYVPLAIRTEKPLLTSGRLVHGCLGLLTEIGEGCRSGISPGRESRVCRSFS
jgi:hypothetical protein